MRQRLVTEPDPVAPLPAAADLERARVQAEMVHAQVQRTRRLRVAIAPGPAHVAVRAAILQPGVIAEAERIAGNMAEARLDPSQRAVLERTEPARPCRRIRRRCRRRLLGRCRAR